MAVWSSGAGSVGSCGGCGGDGCDDDGASVDQFNMVHNSRIE